MHAEADRNVLATLIAFQNRGFDLDINEVRRHALERRAA